MKDEATKRQEIEEAMRQPPTTEYISVKQAVDVCVKQVAEMERNFIALQNIHADNIKAERGDAVAAALREAQENEKEMDAEIVRLETEIAKLRTKLTEEKQYYEADYQMLKAERDKYEKDAIFHRVKVEDLKEERDAAYLRGLERAKEIGESHSHLWKAIGGIQAEIDKAGKP